MSRIALIIVSANLVAAGILSTVTARNSEDWVMLTMLAMLPSVGCVIVLGALALLAKVQSGWLRFLYALLLFVSAGSGVGAAAITGGEDPIGWAIGFMAGFIVSLIGIPLIFALLFGWLIVLFVSAANANHPETICRRHCGWW